MAIKTNKPEEKKSIRDRIRLEKEAKLKEKCKEYAQNRFGEKELAQMSNANKGLWYLPVMDDDENILKFALMRPISRELLGYASTKLQEGDLYAFLEACMRECFVDGDTEILDDDDYFIPAANQFNKIIEGKKAALIKH